MLVRLPLLSRRAIDTLRSSGFIHRKQSSILLVRTISSFPESTKSPLSTRYLDQDNFDQETEEIESAQEESTISAEGSAVGQDSDNQSSWTQLSYSQHQRNPERPPPWGQPFSYPDGRPLPPRSHEDRRIWQANIEKALIRDIKYGEKMELPQNRMTRPLLLTLDAFDTLFHPRDPVPQQYCQVAAAFGIDLDPSAVEANFKRAFKELSKTHPNYGKDQGMGYHKWWTALIEDTLKDIIPESSRDELPKISKKLVTRFSSKAGYELFEDVQPFLAMVGATWRSDVWAPSRTMLGIISNSDPRAEEVLTSYHIPVETNLFPPRYVPSRGYGTVKHGPANPSFATFSYNCGYSKPDRMIFDAAARDAQIALDRLQVYSKLSKTGLKWLNNIREDFHHLHVGDELEKDVLPALECGWDAIWLDRNAEEEISNREINGRQITVINNLMALSLVVCKERLELSDGSPAQAPVWMDATRGIDRISATSSPSNFKGAEPGRGILSRHLHRRKNFQVYSDGQAAWRRVKDQVGEFRERRNAIADRKERDLQRAFAKAFRVQRRIPIYTPGLPIYDQRFGTYRARIWRHVPFSGKNMYADGWLARPSKEEDPD